MTRSMTGYATGDGAAEEWRWTWEIRAVNGRGLDLRVRLPDQIDGLDGPVRAALQKAVARGNVSVGLRLSRDDVTSAGAVSADGLTTALGLLKRVEEAALGQDIGLRKPSSVDVLAMRGVLEMQSADTDQGALRDAVLSGLEPLLIAFNGSRDREGAALDSILRKQIGRIGDAATEAREVLGERSEHMAEGFRAAVARLREVSEGVDEARIAQELAMMAIKADVTEELDRLDAHVAAARALLDGPGPKGRKLDFLTQEFNREANTLCSKAQFAELTRIGLDLKHVIDQMREQVQNVE